MKIRYMLLSTAFISIMTASGYANTVNISTQEFVDKAIIANEFEIQTSQLALKSSDSPAIKSFAKKMIDDHSTTAGKMKEALNNSQTRVTTPDGLDGDHQRVVEKLKSVSGEEFDHQYLAIQTDAHKAAVKLFSDYSKTGADSSLKSFASNTLPALKMHLRHVQELNPEPNQATKQ